MSIALEKNDLLKLYQSLLLIRVAEEKIQQEYRNDDMKTPVHLGIGTEAIYTGVHYALGADHSSFGTYRSHALYLAMTGDANGFFAELYGKATGPAKGKAGSMHMALPEQGVVATSAIVASTIPVAVGAAFANKYKGINKPVSVFFGDGAVEEGVFWESLNFASLHKLNVLFVCEDNDLAIHTPGKERRGYKSIIEAVNQFHCLTGKADGSDLTEMISETKKLTLKMSEEQKPGFLYTPYFRFLEHVGINEDFNFGYRAKPDLTEWEHQDPVKRFEKTCLASGITTAELAIVSENIKAQVNEAVHQAKTAPFADSTELYTDVFA